jgi:heme/copper-type cytochrome/quinol oxidase subunit 1
MGPWLYDGVWLVSDLAGLPALGLLVLWLATLAAGRPRLASPLAFAATAAVLLTLGVGLLARWTTIESFDLFDTTWTSGQAYTVLLGTLAAAFGGLVFWAPKLYGALVPEAVGRLAAPLLLLGTLAVAIAYGLAGVLDQPSFLVAAEGLDDLDTIEALNLVAAIGAVVVVAGALLFVLGVLRAGLSRARTLADDPWNGHTLEWATSSPPPVGNFAGLPEITSEAPVYDARYRAATASPATEATS